MYIDTVVLTRYNKYRTTGGHKMTEPTLNPIELASDVADMQNWMFIPNEDNTSVPNCQLVQEKNGVKRTLHLLWVERADAIYLRIRTPLPVLLERHAKLALMEMINEMNQLCTYGSWYLDTNTAAHMAIVWKDEINTDVAELTSEGLECALTNAFGTFEQFIYAIFRILEGPLEESGDDGEKIITILTVTVEEALEFIADCTFAGHA